MKKIVPVVKKAVSVTEEVVPIRKRDALVYYDTKNIAPIKRKLLESKTNCSHSKESSSRETCCGSKETCSCGEKIVPVVKEAAPVVKHRS